MFSSFAIVIEWETRSECPSQRVESMLRALNTQIVEHSGGTQPIPETIICFNRADAGEAEIHHVIDLATGGKGWPGTLRVVSAVDPLDYYQQKNFGFTFTTNDIVIFLDSDVIPQPGWLATLLSAMQDGRKAVVMGRTHLETGSLYERAVALSWIFDTRSDGPIHPVRGLKSNNIAFRRALFGRLPFPDFPTYRGQCTELGKAIGRAGVVIFEEPRARGVHPAHDGMHRLLTRAVHAGRDTYFFDCLQGIATARQGLTQWRRDLGSVARRIAERRGTIQANALDVSAARTVGGLYYLIKLMAYEARIVRGLRGRYAGRGEP